MATFFDTEKIFKGKFIDIKKYRFTFGKYRDELLKDIMKFDSDYIVWCHKNVSWFSLSKKDFKKISSLAEKQKRKINQVRQKKYSYNNFGPYSDFGYYDGMVEYGLEVYGNDAPF